MFSKAPSKIIFHIDNVPMRRKKKVRFTGRPPRDNTFQCANWFKNECRQSNPDWRGMQRRDRTLIVKNDQQQQPRVLCNACIRYPRKV